MAANPKPTKQLLLAGACLLVVAGCAVWTWRTQFAAPRFNVVLHQSVGRALAGETARLVNNSGKVVVIAIELAAVPELKAQLDEFERTLHRFPHIKLEKSYKLETDDKPKYSFGTGLSGRRFVRIVNKNPDADAVVSFIGAPMLSGDEVAQLKKTPLFIAEARSVDKLKSLFDQKILHAAVVSRFQFPTPIKGKPRTPQEWFDQRFQIVTTNNAAELPTGKGE